MPNLKAIVTFFSSIVIVANEAHAVWLEEFEANIHNIEQFNHVGV